MTSLYPGMLFYSSGLNKKSTPVGPEATPSEIERKLGRVSFNCRPWPKSSPISAVYDVRNSSTRMIILNNKLSRKPKGSRLRGQTDHEGEIMQPEPERHIPDSSNTNWEHHKQCTVSVREKFVPVFPPGLPSTPQWVNKTQRPPMKFDNGSGVNPNHHIQCQGHMDYDIIRWYNANRRPHSRPQSRPQSRSSTRESRALSPIINDPSLSRGEKRYLSSIAKIYSVDNMRLQKQAQYNQLMWKEVSKGSYKERDWEKYNRYLNTPRKTQFGPCDPYRGKRATSAPGNRKGSSAQHDENDPNRPQTNPAQTSREKGPRGRLGDTPNSSRPRERRGGGKPVSSQRNSKQRDEMPRSSRRRKQEDLTGKPARIESPLILKPRRSSVSSMSSLEDETRGSSSRKDEKKPRELKSEHPEAEKDSQNNDKKPAVKENEDTNDTSERATNVKIKVDEVEERAPEDEDERSKMSARDTARADEERGQALHYKPASGERHGLDERSNEADSQHSGNKSQNTEKHEEAHVHFEEKKENKEQPKDDISSDDTPEIVHHHIHKEGKDRPLSRLGGREQFMMRKTEPVNSDDDYSDDPEDESYRERSKAEDTVDQTRGDQSEKDPSPAADKTAMTAETVSDHNRSDKRGESELAGTMLSPQQKEDGASDLSSRFMAETIVSSEQGKMSYLEPDTPTESSSQEKPSEISTIEY